MLDSLVNTSHASIRNVVKKIIYEALVNKEELDSNSLLKMRDLSIDIETSVYTYLFKPDDKGAKYLARAKAIASNLQDKTNEDFRSNVISGDLDSKELALMEVKMMASSELKSKRLMAEKDSFNSIRSDWHEVHAPVAIGMHTCDNCKGQRTRSKEIQLRGADEPMTLYWFYFNFLDF